MCFGGKTNTSTSEVKIPPEVLARYNAVNANAETTAATPFKSYSDDPNAFVAGLNDTQRKGIADISGSGGSAGLGNLDIEKYMNPYVNDVAKSTMDLLTQQNEQEMSGQKGNAIMGGANFGDRSGVAAANLARQQQLGSASALSNIFSQGFSQAQGTAQQQQGADLSARQADLARRAGVGQAEMQAGQVSQNTEQAGKTALYNQFQQQRAYPFQTAQFLANIAEGTGALSGSTTTSTKPAGFFSGFAEGGSVEDRTGLAAGIPMAFDPDAGAYGLGAGSPGARGYVPGAHLPVGHLMTANAPQDEKQTTASDVMNAATKIGDIAKNGPGEWDKLKNVFQSPTLYARGGRTGLAAGGLPYDDSDSYVPDNTPQEAPKLATAKTDDSDSGGGFGKVLDIAKNIIPFFLAHGGRAGFETGGLPFDDQNYALDGDQLVRREMDPNNVSNSEPQKTFDSSNGPGAPTDGSWENWLQHQASKVGLAEDRPVEQIRQEARGNLSPANYPEQHSNDPLSKQTNRKGMSDWTDSIANLAKDLLTAKAPSGVAINGGGGYGNPATMGKSSGVVAVEPPPTAPVAVPALSGVAAATIQPPIEKAPAAAEIAPASNLAPPAAPSGIAAAAATPEKVAAPVDPTVMVPIPAPIKPKPQGLEVADLNGPKTMTQVQPPKSVNNAFQIYSESALHHEGLGINKLDPNGGTLAGFDASFYGKSLNAVGPRDIARAQKKWYDQQGGDQLSQKYGPNFAAAYVNLSMLNPSVTKNAHAQAGGDPKKFFGLVSGQLQNIAERKMQKGFPNYAPSWMKRVADNAKIAGGALPPETAMASNSNDPVAPGLASANRSTQIASDSSGRNQISPTSDRNETPSGLAGIGNFINDNKSTIMPILTGLGAMASSPSRYFGTALLQGLGAGANAYTNYPKTQADIATAQAAAQHEQQLVQQGDIYKNAAGVPMVLLPNGTMTLSQWRLAGKPATRSQPEGSVNPSEIEGVPTANAGSPAGANQEALQAPTIGTSAVRSNPQPLPENLSTLAKQNGIRVGGSDADALAKNPEINDPFTPAAQVSNDAIALQPQVNALANSLADLPANYSGPVASENILPYRKAINDLAGQIGLPPLFDSSGVADTEEIKKITTQIANQSTKSVAAQALMTMLTAFPSDHLSKKGQGQTVANLLTTQQMMRDEAEYGNRYRSEIEQRYGLQPNQSQVSGAGFKQAFAQFEQPKIQKEKQLIEKMFNDPLNNNNQQVVIDGKPQTVLGYMIKSGGNLSPAFIQMLQKQYGPEAPEIIRYFNGGKGG